VTKSQPHLQSSQPAPAGRRPYDIVVFDLDGTLIQGTIFIWQTLHDAFGTDRERRKRAKEDFFAGRISYQEWFEHDLVLLGEAGATRQGMLEALSVISPTPGASETLEALRLAGVRLAILSGSLDLVLERFYSEVPFVEVLINRLRFDSSGRIAGGEHTPFDVEHKGAGILEIARRQGVPISRVAFVGDNYNDVSAAREAGLAIAFNPRSSDLATLSHVVINDPDLRSLLPHLLPTASA
jgi:phosphoserine phosphatase